MKKSHLTTVLLVLLVLALLVTGFMALGQSRLVWPGSTANWSGPFCPFCGRGGYGPGMGGPGMMGPGYGHVWGQGMMGPGYGHGWGMGWGMGQGFWPNQGWTGRNGQARKMSKADIEALLRYRLSVTGNPNLKVGQVTDAGDYFEASIVTKEGSLVEKFRIDKTTGRMQSTD